MRTKRLWLKLGSVVAAAAAVWAVLYLRTPPVEISTPVAGVPSPVAVASPEPVTTPAPVEAAPAAPEPTMKTVPKAPDVAPPTPATARPTGTQTAAKKSGGKPAPKDPLAREALSLVGYDPDAEEYWIAAINDPELPPGERQDLIEDLNEDGLTDPRRPTVWDLPLILSRLELIEAVAWDAMDQVNADAFAEAYKDLVNMANNIVAQTGR